MAYQVLNMKASPTMSKAESDEHQRNWSREQLHRQNQKPRNFYDPTRQNLNFEIDADGKVRPINTSPSVHDRMESRCQQLGSKPPKKDAKQPRNRVVKIVVSGDTEVMRRLAFGGQQVDYTKDEKKTANVGLRREKDIEEWAKDVHNFMGWKFGKENIVGFDCHLDENSPHIHIAIVPVGPNGKVSYAGVFGSNAWEVSAFMRNLHTEFAEQVSSKWGMERGEDTSGRDVHHRDKPEYYAMLSRDIRVAETRLKSLQTMVRNMESEMDRLERERDEVLSDIAAGNKDSRTLETRLDSLSKRIDDLDGKLKDKYEKLRLANEQLAELKEKSEDKHLQVEKAERQLNHLANEMANDSGIMARGAMFEWLYPVIKQQLASPEMVKSLGGDRSMIEGLDDEAILDLCHATVRSFFYGISGGDTVSVGTGGGGSTSGLKWRDEDENETYAAFMRRCLLGNVKKMIVANRPRMKR